MMPPSSGEKGLTLLEILIVVAIISVIAGISVPNIASWTSSRTINSDLGTVTKLIDYARINSVKEKKMFLLINYNSARELRLYESINTNTSTACTAYNASTFQDATGHSGAQSITSNLLAQKAISSGFTNPSTELCFFANGTVSTDTTGYELSYEGEAYRIMIWLTGFYELHRSTDGSCPANKVAYDQNNNVIPNWCETNR